MSDYRDLGPDPLAGRDPHPREQLDLWPLHDARQELLEEIVSQPGPAESTPTRRILVPVGIAAALLLVAGGAWAAISAGGDGKSGDDTVAASVVSTAVDPTTTPTTAATETDTSEPPAPVKKHRHDRARQLRRLDSMTDLEDCLRVLRRTHGDSTGHLRLRKLESRNGGGYRVYIVRKGGRVVAVDGRCRTFAVRDGRMPRH